MHGRRVDGRTLEFGHSGRLHEQSFVMVDKQTGSFCLHVKGRAEAGELAGKQLRMIPSTTTSWAQWKNAYPHTLVLGGARRGGFMGTFGAFEGRDDEVGLMVAVLDRARPYPPEALREYRVINDRVFNRPVAIFWEDGAGATAWSREVEESVLSFGAVEGQETVVRDEQTGTRWSRLTGEAFSGPLKGRSLSPANAYSILVERFRAFYPEGTIFPAETSRPQPPAD